MSKLHLIGVDIDKSIQELWDNEILKFRPNCILAVGDWALYATTGLRGILSYRGSILNGRGFKVVPTIHPAALFSRFDGDKSGGGLSYVYTKLIQSDIVRAAEESKTSEIVLPQRELKVARDSLQLYRFFREYAKSEKCAVDIESINCVPVCVGFAFNKHHAISVPLFTKVGKIQLTDMSESENDECWKLVDTELRRIKIIGQNFKYDDYKLSLIGYECPNVYSDTLIKTRVIFPELPKKDLGTLASLWTREPYWKQEGKEFKLGKSPTDQLFLYNAKDCAVNFEVDEEQEQDLRDLSERYHVDLVDYYYNYMMKKHKFYLKMENVGFAVDFEKKKELKITYTAMQKFVHERLTERIGYDVNVKSYPQMYQLLYKAMKFKPYVNNPTSEESIVKLMQTHCKGKDGKQKIEILEDILEERRIRDQKSRYINFTPDYDNRCKTSFNIIATETCRSSTSVPDKPLRPTKMGLAFHTISKHGRLAKDIRSMFKPDKGKVFIQADGSQFQARVVAVLAEDWDLLKAFDTVDLHRRTAGLCFGLTKTLVLTPDFIPVVDELDKDSPERFTGKKIRHAGNFDMKERRFMTEFNTDAQKFEIKAQISEWKAKTMLEAFHAASPKLRSVFHQDVKDCIISTRTLIDPFGGVRVFNGRMDEDLFKEGYANIPQRTEGHVIQKAALAVSDTIDWQEAVFVSENHDSLLMQVPENDWERYARLLKTHMEKAIDFSKYCSLKRDIQLVIPCDIEISDTNYAEMRKVKLN